jgi:hypothetical protein
MTVKQLKEKLQSVDDNLDVFIHQTTEFGYGPINNVLNIKMNFSEVPDGKPLCSEWVIVLTDEC